MHFKSLKALAAAATIALMAGSAGAAPVTFNFSGPDNRFNPGPLGDVPWAGSLTVDTSVGTRQGNGFAGAVTGFTLNTATATVTATNFGACQVIGCNSVQPTDPFGPDGDAIIITYEGDFAVTGLSFIDSIYFEVRTAKDLYTDGAPGVPADTLFNPLAPGVIVDLDTSDEDSSFFFSLVVSTGEPGIEETAIYRAGDLGGVTVTAAPIPLPASLPLALLGLAALTVLHRKRARA